MDRWIYRRLEEPINVKHIFTPLFLSGYCCSMFDVHHRFDSISFRRHRRMTAAQKSVRKIIVFIRQILRKTQSQWFIATPTASQRTQAQNSHWTQFSDWGWADQNISPEISRSQMPAYSRRTNVRTILAWMFGMLCAVCLRHHANDRIPIIIGFYASRFCFALISIRILWMPKKKTKHRTAQKSLTLFSLCVVFFSFVWLKRKAITCSDWQCGRCKFVAREFCAKCSKPIKWIKLNAAVNGRLMCE